MLELLAPGVQPRGLSPGERERITHLLGTKPQQSARHRRTAKIRAHRRGMDAALVLPFSINGFDNAAHNVVTEDERRNQFIATAVAFFCYRKSGREQRRPRMSHSGKVSIVGFISVRHGTISKCRIDDTGSN